MSELYEKFARKGDHQAGDENCPFCPKDDNNQHYKTYKGVDNNSTNLGKIINAPKRFGEDGDIETDARPKNGEKGKDDRINQNFIETSESELEHSLKAKCSKWSFQAHHAISGNQCLKGHDVEKFIIAGDKVKYDTGYSINNPQNGVWMPSVPANETWPVDSAEKFALAKEAMNEFSRQFHFSHHNISVDVDGLDPATHKKYTEYVKGELKDLNDIINDWEAHCSEKPQDEDKHIGNTRIHSALDHISDHIIKKLKGSPANWIFFISRHARDYTRKTINPNIVLEFEKS